MVSFLIIFVVSVIIGAVLAFTISWIFLKQLAHPENQNDSNIEISLMVLCPWIAYLIAEGLNMSGIVAVLINGAVLSTYGAPNMSRKSREALKLGYETASYAC